MKFFAILCVISALIYAAQAEECADKIIDTMVKTCTDIRGSLASLSSLDPKHACCTEARFDICKQGVQTYTTVAKATRVCTDAFYDDKMKTLSSSVATDAVKKLCENYDKKQCITEAANTAWQQVTGQLNTENIQQTISKNVNSAMDILGNFAKNITSQIQAVAPK